MYRRSLGGGRRHIGEATTLAYAEMHDITAMVDDEKGRRLGNEHGLRMTDTLQLLCHHIRSGMISHDEARRVIDLLVDHGAFLPCDGDTFIAWAQAEGLLDP